MKTNKLLAALSLPLLFSGCVYIGQPFQNQTGAYTARVYVDPLTLSSFVSPSETRVSFMEIDGRPLLPSGLGETAPEVFLRPGRHSFTLSLQSSDHVRGQGNMNLRVQPGRTYKVSAQESGTTFDVTMWDVTDGESNRTPWAQFSVHGELIAKERPGLW
jgi:hypothetical protein